MKTTSARAQTFRSQLSKVRGRRSPGSSPHPGAYYDFTPGAPEALARVAVRLRLRRDLAHVHAVDLLDQVVGDEVGRRHLLGDDAPFHEEVHVVAVVDLRVLSPALHAG